MFKDVTTTDQIARITNVLFSIEILDVGDPCGGALHVRSLIARVEPDPAIPAFLAEQGQEVSLAAAVACTSEKGKGDAVPGMPQVLARERWSLDKVSG
jgi:hypothetical protein